MPHQNGVPPFYCTLLMANAVSEDASAKQGIQNSGCATRSNMWLGTTTGVRDAHQLSQFSLRPTSSPMKQDGDFAESTRPKPVPSLQEARPRCNVSRQAAQSSALFSRLSHTLCMFSATEVRPRFMRTACRIRSTDASSTSVKSILWRGRYVLIVDLV